MEFGSTFIQEKQKKNELRGKGGAGYNFFQGIVVVSILLVSRHLDLEPNCNVCCWRATPWVAENVYQTPSC
jgi:hypothetical protein